MRRLLLGIFLALSITSAQAQRVDVDLSKISPELATRILEAQKKTEPTLTVDNTEKWAQIGKNLAEGVSATAKGLSVEVNEFVKTPVGKFTFFIIAWKFFGAKLWAVIAATIIWILGGLMIYKSFSWFHKERSRVKSVEGRTKTYEYTKYQWESEEAKVMSVISHVFFFGVLSIICMVQIF